MGQISVTVNSTDAADFAARIERIEKFARRVHLDFSDGIFSPVRTINPAQAYAVDGVQVDLHVMLQQPEAQFETLLSLEPDLMIFHAESEGDILSLIKKTQSMGSRAGVAVLQETSIESVRDLVEAADHLLIFTGHLGFNGGNFDETVLVKAGEAKKINPQIEIGADGGLNASNAQKALLAGIDVLCVGSAVHNADNPKKAYDELIQLAQGGEV